jgi:outer membrane protein assembly factor BamE (lipoprotein component of BamABCDE complex)
MKKLILIAFSLFMTACVYTQNTHQDQNNHIDKQKMVQIEVGKTDKQWVINNMGMPDKIQSDNNGIEIYEYINETKIKADRKFIFLFSINSEKVTAKRILSLSLKNGIVDSINTRDETK